MDPRLYIITGSSGVGKTTIIPILKGRLSGNYDVHDFDEKLTKEVAMDASLLDQWRKDTTAYWLKLAEDNAIKNKSTIVVGLIFPSEVISLGSSLPIKFYLLDASDSAIKERLYGKRFSAPEKVAGLKEATGQTPEEFIEENKVLMQKLREEIKTVSGEVIDTSNDTLEQTAEKIITFLE